MSAQHAYSRALAQACGIVDGDSEQMLLDTADRVLRESDSVRRFRAARGCRPNERAKAVWRQLCSLGLVGACAPLSAGGSGLEPRQGVLLTEAWGRRLPPEPFLAAAFVPLMVLRGLGGPAAHAVTAGIVSGDVVPACAFQEAAISVAIPEPKATIASVKGQLFLSGSKCFVQGAAWATHFIVSAQNEDETCLLLIDRTASGLSVTQRIQADGTSVADLTFERVDVSDGVLGTGRASAAALEFTLDWALVATSAELFGAASTLFELTIDYLGARTQFGQPIGAFQALQHRAADLYCEKEIARFAIADAVASLGELEGADRTARASRCKARAAHAATRIARESIQMHGAIGFSDEADIGLYVNRILVLCAWLGGADHHRRRYAQLKPLRVH